MPSTAGKWGPDRHVRAAQAFDDGAGFRKGPKAALHAEGRQQVVRQGVEIAVETDAARDLGDVDPEPRLRVAKVPIDALRQAGVDRRHPLCELVRGPLVPMAAQGRRVDQMARRMLVEQSSVGIDQERQRSAFSFVGHAHSADSSLE
jgi:hypothetical protein